MKVKIDYAQAREILESQTIGALGVERVFLYEALGRILARDVVAIQDIKCANLGWIICQQADLT